MFAVRMNLFGVRLEFLVGIRDLVWQTWTRSSGLLLFGLLFAVVSLLPRKIRQLISDLEKAGFVNRGGKGSHRNFEHIATGVNLTLSGQTGADAKIYQEKDIREAIEKVTRK